jgi:hypothetical protein
MQNRSMKCQKKKKFQNLERFLLNSKGLAFITRRSLELDFMSPVGKNSAEEETLYRPSHVEISALKFLVS